MIALTLPQIMQQAVAAYSRADWVEADRLCRLVLNAKSDYFDALNLMGIIAAQSGCSREAAAYFERAAAANPNDASARSNLGNALQELKRLDEALASYAQALRIDPNDADVYFNRGNALHDLRRFDEALASYAQALRLAPAFAEAHCNRGITLQELKRLDEALSSYDKALKLRPDLAEAYGNRGNALKELKRLDEALASYDQALKLKPDYAEAYSNRSGVLQGLNRLDEALASCDQALRFKPDYADAHNNRGNALKALKRPAEALASYDQALKLKPDDAEVCSNRAKALEELQRLDEALASYDQAVKLKPDYAEVYANRGVVLHRLGRLDEALASYDRALELNPTLAETYGNRGITLQEMKRLDEALASYNQAMALKPDLEFLDGTRLYAKMQICDWSSADDQIADLAGKIQRSEKASPPFAVLALTSSLPIQRKAAEIWVNCKHPSNFALGPISKRARHEKIRLGYFSADFRHHPVSLLTAELFESHDRNRFDVCAFSTGPDAQDDMRTRLRRAFDRFYDVRNETDRNVAAQARDLQIDIAIDLGGHTRESRPGIFAMRAAPLQISYIGYLGTMGAEYIDYLIADRTLIPENCRQYYSEKIVYLPSFQANDSKRKIADKIFSRDELGLPDRGFVFCCFNNSYKITPQTFDGWMRILKRVDGSVLFLYADNEWAVANLKKQSAMRGVDSQRLIFGNRMPRPEYLARYRAADLFLDTLPYNAGTTASDALWAGLPVLTCTGEAFASRVAASLLNAIGLPELITSTQAEYEALAIELATDPEHLEKIRQKLVRNRLTTPLFDTKVFTTRMEDAYKQMHERYQGNLPPEDIYVAS
jgi:predicted O-linked N-acetylglucosamine transferase (SPINDLY family)